MLRLACTTKIAGPLQLVAAIELVKVAVILALFEQLPEGPGRRDIVLRRDRTSDVDRLHDVQGLLLL